MRFQNCKVWMGGLREGLRRGAIRHWLMDEGFKNVDIVNVYLKNVPGQDAYAFIDVTSPSVPFENG